MVQLTKMFFYTFLQNLTFLTVFLIQFSAQSRLAVISFVLIVFGNIIG